MTKNIFIINTVKNIIRDNIINSNSLNSEENDFIKLLFSKRLKNSIFVFPPRIKVTNGRKTPIVNVSKKKM